MASMGPQNTDLGSFAPYTWFAICGRCALIHPKHLVFVHGPSSPISGRIHSHSPGHFGASMDCLKNHSFWVYPDDCWEDMGQVWVIGDNTFWAILSCHVLSMWVKLSSPMELRLSNTIGVRQTYRG